MLLISPLQILRNLFLSTHLMERHTGESRFKKDFNLQIHLYKTTGLRFTTWIFLKSISWFKNEKMEFLESRFACVAQWHCGHNVTPFIFHLKLWDRYRVFQLAYYIFHFAKRVLILFLWWLIRFINNIVLVWFRSHDLSS